MNYAKIETPHGTIYSSMDELYSDLLDTGVNPDIRNVKQMVRLYKIKFSGQITLINLDEITEDEILDVLSHLHEKELSKIMETYSYSYDENESTSRNNRCLAELIRERQEVA